MQDVQEEVACLDVLLLRGAPDSGPINTLARHWGPLLQCLNHRVDAPIAPFGQLLRDPSRVRYQATFADLHQIDDALHQYFFWPILLHDLEDAIDGLACLGCVLLAAVQVLATLGTQGRAALARKSDVKANEVGDHPIRARNAIAHLVLLKALHVPNDESSIIEHLPDE
eukprot:9483094-Pyramimonas_sp.AAC.1